MPYPRLHGSLLWELRVLRKHLWEALECNQKAAARQLGTEGLLPTELIYRHLGWVNNALVEEHPGPHALQANMHTLETEANVLARIAKDVPKGE